MLFFIIAPQLMQQDGSNMGIMLLIINQFDFDQTQQFAWNWSL
jgi:hypothetical protein